ncbi:DNA starvation/stationary phase protection protein [Thermobifida alba]|uniref:DNA starvation/stationary phase protection protein n=1 Tax=Thermobifida alba TaxID=53522 RepID=A0ABY4L0C8_THEAE|nr:DNA starvation/stationary phase protection protein [Thermobifida alba]UPT19640.1 DNA starvation/stationary phase protection protein [Thermobifida alba]HLU99213.1 DNA starvation/stationary phase protection protein [Thermobifida alba]
MAKIHGALTEEARKTTGQALQAAIVDLIDLTLLGKQAHWNVIGRNFRSIHLQLDELVAAARRHTDVLAERAVAIGVTPDGRSGRVAEDTRLPQLDPGYVQDDKVVAFAVEALSGAVERFQEHIRATEDADPVTQDLLIAASQDLEQQHWMFQAMS